MESDERREIIKIYWQQYLLLEKRMIELSDYVAIDRKNYATFSNQFISMYLIICSEIDSVADEYCKRFLEQDKKNTFGITNKINLILHEYPKLQDWRCQTRACWHYFSHVKMHAIWTNDRKITSSLSYLVHTLRNAFSHRNSLSIIFLCLYSSWSYSHGFMRFFFGGTTGLCPKDWQSSLVLSPS